MAYKSLKDIYLSQTYGRKIPVLPRQDVYNEQVGQPVEVPQEPVQTAIEPVDSDGVQQDDTTEVKPQTINKIKVPFSLDSVHEASWPVASAGVPFNTKSFTPHVGEGNGERKVASLFHPQMKKEPDNRYTERLGTFIAGQNESFDVVSEQGNFEVKEFKLAKNGKYRGSVRIGAEGKHTTGMILSQVKDLLIILLQTYSSLDNDSKKVLNDNLIKNISTTNDIPPGWNLENYIDAIFDVTIGEDKGITEFPKTLFHGQEINPNLFTRNKKRATYLVYTIPQILNALKQLALQDQNQANLDNEINRVKNLQSTLKGLYLKKDDEKFSKEIEKEAESLDRKLISKACLSDRGSNCITINTFLQKLERLDLGGVFNSIDQLRQSEVANIFPPEVVGFFAVFETKYKYIPRALLKDYMVIDSFTQKGLKIALKSENV